MEIVGKVAATLQNVLGPEAEELGRATGVIERRRQFTAVSLLRMLVLTLLRKPDAKATDFQSTAAQLGLDVTFDGRRESLHASTRGVPSCGAGTHRAPGVGRVASNRRPAEQVHERSHRRQQYHRTVRKLPDQFPGCGGTCAGLAAMKITCGGIFLTGSILQLRITPWVARAHATNPIAQEVAPAGSAVAVRPGAHFCLDRFQTLRGPGLFKSTTRQRAKTGRKRRCPKRVSCKHLRRRLRRKP